MFEISLQIKFSPFLSSDDIQFGFKKLTSTSHVLYTLESCVDYFTTRGANVYVTFLDCTKVFDHISHYGLFAKLMARNVPLRFLLILMFWYLNMSCECKWGDSKVIFDRPHFDIFFFVQGRDVFSFSS